MKLLSWKAIPSKKTYFWHGRFSFQCLTEIRSSKKTYFNKLDDILSKENVNSKIFWKTSKQVMSLQKSNHAIPTPKLNDKLAENDIDKTNMLNDTLVYRQL